MIIAVKPFHQSVSGAVNADRAVSPLHLSCPLVWFLLCDVHWRCFLPWRVFFCDNEVGTGGSYWTIFLQLPGERTPMSQTLQWVSSLTHALYTKCLLCVSVGIRLPQALGRMGGCDVAGLLISRCTDLAAAVSFLHAVVIHWPCPLSGRLSDHTACIAG